MKTCTKCKEQKESSEFYKQGKYLKSHCKPCYNEHQKTYKQSDAGKKSEKKYRQSEARKESQKKYRQSEAGKEHQKKYRESDEGKDVRREYYKTDAYKECKKKYNKTDAYKENRKKYEKEFINTEKYFKQKLNARGFKDNEITPELIELQKLSIVTHRYTQQLNQVKQ
jgi:hypothetical protein